MRVMPVIVCLTLCAAPALAAETSCKAQATDKKLAGAILKNLGRASVADNISGVSEVLPKLLDDFRTLLDYIPGFKGLVPPISSWSVTHLLQEEVQKHSQHPIPLELDEPMSHMWLGQGSPEEIAPIDAFSRSSRIQQKVLQSEVFGWLLAE